MDIAQDRCVELAAVHSPGDHRVPGSGFSTIVRVDPEILQERGGEAAKVHGISAEEIAQGPPFPEAWARFQRWTDDLLNSSVLESDQDTSDDEPRAPHIPEEPPTLVLAAHNGARSLHV